MSLAILRQRERREVTVAIREVVDRTARLRRIAAVLTAEAVPEALRTTLLRTLLDAERHEVPMADIAPRDAEPVEVRPLFDLLASLGLDPDTAAHVVVVATVLEREVAP